MMKHIAREDLFEKNREIIQDYRNNFSTVNFIKNSVLRGCESPKSASGLLWRIPKFMQVTKLCNVAGLQLVFVLKLNYFIG